MEIILGILSIIGTIAVAVSFANMNKFYMKNH